MIIINYNFAQMEGGESMNDYVIIENPQDDFAALVILCTSDSPLSFTKQLENDLKCKNISGRILVDQILHVGNNEDRFISVLVEQKIMKESFKYEQISKKSIFREISCKYLNQYGLIDDSILSHVQTKMIKKGIAI
jgi:hypothetical protein